MTKDATYNFFITTKQLYYCRIKIYIFRNITFWFNFQFSTFNFQFNLGVPATPSGFPLYLCSLHFDPLPNPAPVHKSRSRSQIPIHSQRMPLQSLTLLGDRKREQVRILNPWDVSMCFVCRLHWRVSTLIFNFPFSIFNSYRLHRVFIRGFPRA